MYTRVHKPINTPGIIDNKGSCIKLADYLEKENTDLPSSDKIKFFSHQYDSVAKSTVINSIDTNVQKLSRKDDKFYMLSLNPSHKECCALIKNVTGKDISDFDLLSKEEKELVFTDLRDYTRKCMDLYASNFERNDIHSGEDLVYYAKIETKRKFKFYDKEVIDGTAFTDKEKPGLNLHVHVIVSRKDKTGKIKLSPLAKSRGNTWNFEGKEVKRGFNHEKWKIECGNLFFNSYKYKPNYTERYRTSNMSKTSNKAINKVKSELLQGQFSEERKIMSNVKLAIRAIREPKNAIISSLKRKVRDIIQGNEKGG